MKNLKPIFETYVSFMMMFGNHENNKGKSRLSLIGNKGFKLRTTSIGTLSTTSDLSNILNLYKKYAI